MFATVGPSFEFIRFFQIIAWILVPVLLSVTGLTIFFHYRKKKVKPVAEEAEDNLILASPEKFNHNIRDGEYVYFDHSGLIREYKTRMFLNHARYTALRNDYAALEAKYSTLAGAPAIPLINHKKKRMKNSEEQETLVLENESSANLATEKKELTDKLQQLSRSYQRLEEENRFLQEQISLETADEAGKDKIMTRWKEENKTLRDKLAEQDYLESLLEEKKSQISFLQNQLEQRIRNQHVADQQRLQAVSEMEEARENEHAATEHTDDIKKELLTRQEEADKLQMLLCEREEQISQREQVLTTKLDHITYLENVLRELKEQNELLNAEASDNRDIAHTLQQQLLEEQGRTRHAEQKLSAKKQLIRRLYDEFSACMEDEDRSPVVLLRQKSLEG